jgi:hypothetical protein
MAGGWSLIFPAMEKRRKRPSIFNLVRQISGMQTQREIGRRMKDRSYSLKRHELHMVAHLNGKTV